jgi:hypothetical protein
MSISITPKDLCDTVLDSEGAGLLNQCGNERLSGAIIIERSGVRL